MSTEDHIKKCEQDLKKAERFNEKVLARLAFIDKKIVSGKPSAERTAALNKKKEERLKKRAENRINRAQKRGQQKGDWNIFGAFTGSEQTVEKVENDTEPVGIQNMDEVVWYDFSKPAAEQQDLNCTGEKPKDPPIPSNLSKEPMPGDFLEWTCAACTFVNKNSPNICEMCQITKPIEKEIKCDGINPKEVEKIKSPEIIENSNIAVAASKPSSSSSSYYPSINFSFNASEPYKPSSNPSSQKSSPQNSIISSSISALTNKIKQVARAVAPPTPQNLDKTAPFGPPTPVSLDRENPFVNSSNPFEEGSGLQANPDANSSNPFEEAERILDKKPNESAQPFQQPPTRQMQVNYNAYTNYSLPSATSDNVSGYPVFEKQPETENEAKPSYPKINFRV